MKEITIKIKSDNFRAVYKMLNFLKLEAGPDIVVSSVEFADQTDQKKKGQKIERKTFSLEGKDNKERSAKVEDLMKNLSSNIKTKK